MNRFLIGWLLLGCWLVICPDPYGLSQGCYGQEHSHGDHTSSAPKVAPPKVFLDKSPRIVAYQLKRLDNQRLLMVERRTTDAKYIPVYTAILSRVGMSPQYRDEAVEALVALQDSTAVKVLLEAIEGLDSEDRDELRTARQLAGMLLRRSGDDLRVDLAMLQQAFESEVPLESSIGAAGLILAGSKDSVFDAVDRDPETALAFLSAVALIPKPADRDALRGQIVPLLDAQQPLKVRRAAVTALGSVRENGGDTFNRLAGFVADDALRNAAVKTLLKVPSSQREPKTCEQLAQVLVTHAEETPAAERTSDRFIDAMELADQLMAKLPSPLAKELRGRLSAVTVRVIRIRTVEEEMRYDLPYFAVEAGASIQIVLENHDLMPHNLVITAPGALKEVALQGLQVGPNGGLNGLQYVPKSDKVLEATQMIAPDQQFRLTFNAPTEVGEYPYVCTFPQHWYRMYGVMVVVDDLDAWLKDPVEPANPIGSNRSFVQAWTVEDLQGDLESQLRGRSADIGKRLFAEASCAGCHKMSGQGGVIGPELTDIMKRWKGDKVGILREIIDPSHKVDAKYVMQRILTVDGRTLSGVLLEETDDVVKLLDNPESKKPTVISQDDIEAMVPSSVSMMPKALLDQYTKDEIYEILAYLIDS